MASLLRVFRNCLQVILRRPRGRNDLARASGELRVFLLADYKMQSVKGRLALGYARVAQSWPKRPENR